MKRVMLGWLAAVLMAGAGSAEARTVWEKGYTLLVAPARFSVMQVLFDVIDKRPSVLVSYQANPDNLSEMALHIWNGQEWLGLSEEDFRQLRFVMTPPTRTILIGSAELVPPAVAAAVDAMPDPLVVRDMTNAGLINGLDRAMEWKRAEWRWFTARYNLHLEDEATQYRQGSWYDQQGPLQRRPEDNPLFRRSATTASDLPAETSVSRPWEGVIDVEPAPVIEIPAGTP